MKRKLFEESVPIGSPFWLCPKRGRKIKMFWQVVSSSIELIGSDLANWGLKVINQNLSVIELSTFLCLKASDEKYCKSENNWKCQNLPLHFDQEINPPQITRKGLTNCSNFYSLLNSERFWMLITRGSRRKYEALPLAESEFIINRL